MHRRSPSVALSLAVAALALSQVASARAQDEDVPPRALAERYLTAVASGDTDVVAALVSDDVVFEDPVGATSLGPKRRVEGKAAVLERFGRANPATTVTTRFEDEFTSGEYFVAHVVYTSVASTDVVGRGEGNVKTTIETATVLRIVDGRVVRHVDYVAYDDLLAQLGVEVPAAGAEKLRIANAYFDALAGGDLDAIAALTSERIAYDDPTSVVMGGPWTARGRDAYLAQVRSSELRPRFTKDSAFVARDLVVVRHRVAANANGTALSAAGMTVLTIEDGKVTKRVDYVDYDSMLVEIERVR